MKPGTKIIVSDTTRFDFNKGRIGYFRFNGTEESFGCAICSVENEPNKYGAMTYFVVKREDVLHYAENSSLH